MVSNSNLKEYENKIKLLIFKIVLIDHDFRQKKFALWKPIKKSVTLNIFTPNRKNNKYK